MVSWCGRQMPQFAPDQAGRRGRQRILFQPLSELKTVKDRIQLDRDLGSDAKDEIRFTLKSRGASFLYAGVAGAVQRVHDGRSGGKRVLHRFTLGPPPP